MSCKLTPRTLVAFVSTDGTTSTDVFVPMSAPIPIADFTKVGVRYEVLSRTSDLSVRAGLRYSDDGVSWDTETAVGTAVTTTGWKYLGLNSVSESRVYVQLGMMVKNSNNALVEKGTVRMDLSFRG